MKNQIEAGKVKHDHCQISTYLECVEAFVWVHLSPRGSEAVSRQFLDLGQYVAIEAHVQIAVVLVQVVLELSVAQLIARLVLAVVLSLLLHGVIRQMHHSIG